MSLWKVIVYRVTGTIIGETLDDNAMDVSYVDTSTKVLMTQCHLYHCRHSHQQPYYKQSDEDDDDAVDDNDDDVTRAFFAIGDNDAV